MAQLTVNDLLLFVIVAVVWFGVLSHMRPTPESNKKFAVAPQAMGARRRFSSKSKSESMNSFARPHSFHTMNWQPLRGDMVCCGFGDRLHYLENQVEGVWEYNQSLALHWGPCTKAVPNIINELFDLPRFETGKIPDVLPQGQSIYGFLPNATNPEPYPDTVDEFQQKNIEVDGKNISRVSMRYRFKPGPDQYGILSVPMAKVYHTLFNSIQPKYVRYVDELIEKYDWAKTKTISIHVRTGNIAEGEAWRDKSFGARGRKLSNVDNLLQRYLSMCEDIATKLNLGDFKIFVASDSIKTAGNMQAMTKRKVISRNPLLPIDIGVGHPMVWANLHEHNADENCRIEWFVDPLLDMKLLSLADVFISTSDTGFVTAVQNVVYHNNGVLCFNDGDSMTLTCKRRKSENVDVVWRNRTRSKDIRPNSQWIDGDFIKQFTLPNWFSVKSKGSIPM